MAAVGSATAAMLWYAAYAGLGLGPSAAAYLFLPSTAAVDAAAIPLFTDNQRWAVASKVIIGLCFLLSLGGVTEVAGVIGGPVDRAAILLVAASGLVAAAYAAVAVHSGGTAWRPARPCSCRLRRWRSRSPCTGSGTRAPAGGDR